jgi:hypothetical protein
MDWEQTASGYAAVWAVENTRESIWDAMQRKETYATTGPRMTVRLFGGWDFDAKDAETHAMAAVGYAKGVPMGGDLPRAKGGKAPTFLVAALRDPGGANLDRIQIVKGWLDGRTPSTSASTTSPSRAAARSTRTGGAGRPSGHGRCRKCDVVEHRAPELVTAEGPRLDPRQRPLLRAGDRDPDAAVDGVRRQAVQAEAAEGDPDDDDRALHVADLVHPGCMKEVPGVCGRPSSVRMPDLGGHLACPHPASFASSPCF